MCRAGAGGFSPCPSLWQIPHGTSLLWPCQGGNRSCSKGLLAKPRWYRAPHRDMKGSFLLAQGMLERRGGGDWARRGLGTCTRHGRASWLVSPEISRLEVAGVLVRGCQAVILPDAAPGAGLVGSEWLQKCQASHLRVAREVWLPARPVHPVFVSGTVSHSRCTAGKMAQAQGRERNVSSPADVLLPPLSPPAAQPLGQE